MDILNIINTAKQVEQITVGMAPTISNLVTDAAKVFGLDTSTNAQKLQHVQDRLSAIWTLAGEAEGDFQKLWPVFSLVISGIVKANNIGGNWGNAIAALNILAAA